MAMSLRMVTFKPKLLLQDCSLGERPAPIRDSQKLLAINVDQ
jgi:hypothetical protein